MIDWPVAAANGFLGLSMFLLLVAPIVGAGELGWRRLLISMAVLFVFSCLVLGFSWRSVTGAAGMIAVAHVVLTAACLSLVLLGRALRRWSGDVLLSGLVGLLVALVLTVGPLAAGPAASALSLSASRWILVADPLVAVAAAAGIDVMHIDAIYRLSPLAHRGVTLPGWPASMAIYVTLGLVFLSLSSVRLRSGQ